MKYKIKNWASHQHYKDRCPPWIKLHHSMLTSEMWVMGSDATRSLAVACMLLAARNESLNGEFNGDPEYVKRFAYLNSKPDFNQLIQYDFIELVQDASNVLAKCDTEKSREETETEKSREDRAFALPDWIDKAQWDLWMKTRKGKKMIADQMQAQVEKLSKWREQGFDHCGALANAAANGYTGLFLPDQGKQPTRKTPPPENFSQRNYGTGVQDL
jgi:hypothetical protein